MDGGEGEAKARQVFEKLVGAAKGLLNSLDGSDSEESLGPGTLERIIAAESAVKMLDGAGRGEGIC
jgi:hypothetical protein